MSWFKNLFPSRIRTGTSSKKVPEGLWSKCDKCSSILYRTELERNLEVCPKCDYHMRISARKRLKYFLDDLDAGVEIGVQVLPEDRLKFKDLKKYKDRLTTAQEETGETEALVVMRAQLMGLGVVVAAFEYGFIGGSMGAVVGERFVQAVNACIDTKSPLVCFSASGGARMQEALISLMQMAKVSAALAILSEHRLPFISILTDPTMGGVSASLAMLGDVIIAEPNALVGFAGPRVIEQTVRQKLPEGFQTSEFLLKQGAIDAIYHRSDLRQNVASLLSKLTKQPLLQKKVLSTDPR